MVDLTTIEIVHARLLARYGSAWRAKFAGIDPETVVKDWLHVLGGLAPASLEHALDHLPNDFPPTAGQFRELCLRAPAPAARREISAPRPDPARLKAELERLGKLVQRRSPRQWIADLQARERAGERLSMFQKQCLANAIAAPVLGEDVDDRDRTARLKAETQRKVDEYVPLL